VQWLATRLLFSDKFIKSAVHFNYTVSLFLFSASVILRMTQALKAATMRVG
jgi:hypothetical protein